MMRSCYSTIVFMLSFGILSLGLTGCGTNASCQNSAVLGTWVFDPSNPSNAITFQDTCEFTSSDCDGSGQWETTAGDSESEGTLTLSFLNWDDDDNVNCGEFQRGVYECEYTVSGDVESGRTLSFSVCLFTGETVAPVDELQGFF